MNDVLLVPAKNIERTTLTTLATLLKTLYMHLVIHCCENFPARSPYPTPFLRFTPATQANICATAFLPGVLALTVLLEKLPRLACIC